MGAYDTQQVCKNGHQVTDRYYQAPECQRRFCDLCGAQTMHKCPNCGAEIRGNHQVPGVAVLGFATTPVPKHCHECGHPYPWADKKREPQQAVSHPTEEPLALVEQICSRFHSVVKQLRSRYNSRPTLDIGDEYDVQDLLHSLLWLFFDDIRSEEWTPSYAGACARADFVLRNEQIVIEVKKTRANLLAKQLGDQLMVDIGRYKRHPDCRVLFCFVYDPEGRIANPRGIENDLRRDEDGLKVQVYIAPKDY